MATIDAPAQTRRTRELGATVRGVGYALLLILAAVLAVRALYFFQTALVMVRWPFETNNGEATLLAESRLLDQGLLAGLRTLYGPQPHDRFIAGNYPPVYYLLWVLKPGAPAFPTGRALSVLGGLVAALAGGAAVYRAAGGSRLQRASTALLGAAAFICTVPVFQQIGIAKPDMVALAFAACGLAFFEAAPNQRGTVAAGVCFALALLTKQSIAFALIAATIAALRRGPRALLTLVITTAAVLAAVLGGLWLLAGPSLFEHLVLYNLRPWSESRFGSVNVKFLSLHWPLLVPALGYAAWGLYARGRSALTYYPPLALATLLTVGSEGGGRSYYVELCLAAGLGAALALGALLNARPAWAAPLSSATLLLLAFYAVRAYTVFTGGAYVTEPPSAAEADRINHLLVMVDGAPDPVLILSEDAGYLAMRGRPLVIDDPYLARAMYRQGRWSTAGVVEAIRARRYSLIVNTTTINERKLRPDWGDALVDALVANYQEVGPESWVPKAR
jgi:hypothetical protein